MNTFIWIIELYKISKKRFITERATLLLLLQFLPSVTRYDMFANVDEKSPKHTESLRQ